MTVADAVQLKEELTKAIDDAEKDKREELTEFEKTVYECAWRKITNKTEGESKEEYAKRYATKLLSLAEREIINRVAKECYKEDFCIEDTVKFNEGYKLGKEVAMKGLPRWRRCAETDCDKSTVPPWIVRFDAEKNTTSAIVHQGYFLCFQDLEKLPKED